MEHLPVSRYGNVLVTETHQANSLKLQWHSLFKIDRLNICAVKSHTLLVLMFGKLANIDLVQSSKLRFQN